MASNLTLKGKKMNRHGIIGPLILITAGLLLLVDRLGLVSLSIWSILWNVWPVILILIGLDIIVKNTESNRYYFLGVLLGFLIIIGVVSLVLTGVVPGSKDDDMKDINMKDKYLSGKFMIGSNLNDMNLEGRDFSGGVLIGVNMNNANLHNADFGDSLIIGANMVGANLTDADLGGAVLIGANLYGADLCGADIEGADFIGVDRTSFTTCSD